MLNLLKIFTQSAASNAFELINVQCAGVAFSATSTQPRDGNTYSEWARFWMFCHAPSPRGGTQALPILGSLLFVHIPFDAELQNLT